MAAAVASAAQPDVLGQGKDVPETNELIEKERHDSGCSLSSDESQESECADEVLVVKDELPTQRCVSPAKTLKRNGGARSRTRTRESSSDSQSIPSLQDLRQLQHALQRRGNSQGQAVKSPMAQRIQLRAAFVECFFPKSDGMAYPGFEFITRCSEHSQACLYALDVACLLHISFSQNDKRLQHHARRLYPMALTHLRRDLEATEQDVGQMIATIYVMQLCEQFEPITTDGQGWRRHAQGLLSLIDKLKPGQLEPELQALLCANARAFALWDGILRRKPLKPCKDLCTTTFSENSYGTGSHLNDIATLVPAALALADKLVAEGPSAAMYEVARCIQTIEAIERRLNQWFSELYINKSTPLYWIAHQATSLPDSRLDLDSTVFPHAYVFTHMPVASIHATCWICILSLRGAQLDLHKAFPLQQSENSADYLRRSATHYADNLCMSVAYVTHPKQNYSGLRCSMAPLQLAAMWYKSRGMEEKLEYCRKALASLRRYGLFPPEVD